MGLWKTVEKIINSGVVTHMLWMWWWKTGTQGQQRSTTTTPASSQARGGSGGPPVTSANHPGGPISSERSRRRRLLTHTGHEPPPPCTRGARTAPRPALCLSWRRERPGPLPVAVCLHAHRWNHCQIPRAYYEWLTEPGYTRMDNVVTD